MKLTEWTSCGGCAAKWGGAPLGRLLSALDSVGDESVLIGLAPFDDAAVVRLTEDLALVTTTDFFPPLVDDPSDFGAIAAANACSDVFAMGGLVRIALNIAAFPEDFPPEAIGEILAAAAETVRRAGGSVAGGHTIRSAEPVFGLAVQGTVHPAAVWSKAGAQPGDRLLLSKPLGTGIVLAGADPEHKQTAIGGMRALNDRAAAALRSIEDASNGGDAVHAVTDVTGFGLAGHGWEMAERAGVRVTIESGALPAYPGAADLARAGVRTGGEARNRAYLGAGLESDGESWVEGLVLDPQTSGGLLASVDPGESARLLDEGWWEVGWVEPGPAAVRLVS